MELPLLKPTAPFPRPASGVVEELSAAMPGRVRADALARTIYAVDASIYEIIPAAVVLPQDVDDVVRCVQICSRHQMPVVPRGAGTGLAGGAVGAGVVVDVSRHLRRIRRLDPAAGTAEVEPGVVLDELNAAAAPFGLHFAPDVATSSRATLGGMIANNSCGAHSIIYGRTVDHVLALSVVLGDGTLVRFGPDSDGGGGNEAKGGRAGDGAEAGVRGDARRRAEHIRAGLGAIRDLHADEIERRFPKILRSNGGYGLDRLGPPGTPADPVKVLCGSEGTLGIVVAATLRLTPLPRRRGLVVAPFTSVLAALEATPRILEHRPAAVELVDRTILSAARQNPRMAGKCAFWGRDPEAILVVEFFADDDRTLKDKTSSLMAALGLGGPPLRAESRLGGPPLRGESPSRGGSADEPCHCPVSMAACGDGSPAHLSHPVEILDPAAQADVWAVRSAGLGLLMSRPGDEQSNAFVEDTAVDPARLRDYIERFAALLEREGVSQAGYYAHASVGCLHVRPVLNLKRAADVERMVRIAEAVSSLALEFGGTMTGEHGDGLVRSCWLKKMVGPRITRAFAEVKALFDPGGLMNPGKIVSPRPMTADLRYGPGFRSAPVKTALDFSLHGGPAALAGMCSGVGQCRQSLAGTMCPSYMATGDETHTTRARANALRVSLSNRGLLAGLDDPHLHEVMDLCIGCKACKTECPTGVDMARLKAEFLHARHLRRGASRRARFIADVPSRLPLASRFPRVVNRLTASAPFRRWLEFRYGLDRRIAPPRLAPRTFRHWFRRHRPPASAPRGRVVLFVDTWTNHFQPGVGRAAVALLEAAGLSVECPPHVCCGRPMISQGLLDEARRLAETNLRALIRHAREGTPIIGLEPSCILTFADEFPQLVPQVAARRIAAQVTTIEAFLDDLLEREPQALRFQSTAGRRVLYHAHCHQKALIGSAPAVSLLRRVFGAAAEEINAGCCGMAGSFGHEEEHYDVARAIGEQRLFPAVRRRGRAEIAVSGFSCRTQITHFTDASPRHVVEIIQSALGPQA